MILYLRLIISSLLPETSFEEEILVTECVKYHFMDSFQNSFLRIVLIHAKEYTIIIYESPFTPCI